MKVEELHKEYEGNAVDTKTRRGIGGNKNENRGRVAGRPKGV